MRVLLIPSAVLMPREMRQRFGELPTGLFPLGNQPMLWHLCQKYRERVDKIYVITHRKAERVEAYINARKLPVTEVRLDRLQDIGYTVLCGLQRALEDSGAEGVSELYINFADSLVGDAMPLGTNFFYCSQQEEDAAWTYFTETEGKLTGIFDKEDFSTGKKLGKDFKSIFVGSFGFTDANMFAKALESALAKTGTADSFYRALRDYSQNHVLLPLEARQWFDVGHNENYVKAKTMVAARSFNTIRIDERRGILTKKSENKAKLIDEIRWYLRMPGKLQYLLPRIYDYSLDMDCPYVTMEYYGYHTLHECLLYGDLPLVRWREIFKQLRFVLSDMQSFRLEGRAEECKAAVRQMYIHKTLNRLEKMRDLPDFKRFFVNEVIINGQQYPSLDNLLAELPALIDELLEKDAERHFCVIHGDLCFTNILIEDSLNFMRFIDPRGKFGCFDIYGDSRYEIAKLLHTLEGRYDYVIEDMFELEINGMALDYRILADCDEVFQEFAGVFDDVLGEGLSVRLAEATLFLSMIPLHDNSLRRQYVMMAIGIQLFWQAARGWKGTWRDNED